MAGLLHGHLLLVVEVAEEALELAEALVVQRLELDPVAAMVGTGLRGPARRPLAENRPAPPALFDVHGDQVPGHPDLVEADARDAVYRSVEP